MTGLRPAPGVAIVDENDVVYVASLPDGPIVVLGGVAGAIWWEACDGPQSTIAERVAAVTGFYVEEIRGDVESFVAELVERGLLVAREA